MSGGPLLYWSGDTSALIRPPNTKNTDSLLDQILVKGTLACRFVKQYSAHDADQVDVLATIAHLRWLHWNV